MLKYMLSKKPEFLTIKEKEMAQVLVLNHKNQTGVHDGQGSSGRKREAKKLVKIIQQPVPEFLATEKEPIKRGKNRKNWKKTRTKRGRKPGQK